MQNNTGRTEENRTKIGKRMGAAGIVLNAALSAVKIAVGKAAGSASIVADGLNNLSDAAGAVVTLLGFRLAEKPADKEHPYGHARFEYLASLIIAALILAMGFELVRTSIDKIIHPTDVEFSAAVAGTLVFSVMAKTAMMIAYRHAGRRIQSGTLTAMAADSRNDAIATGVIAAAAATEHFSGLKLDGVMGLLASGLILYSGARLARETVSSLLGETAHPELRETLTAFIESFPEVIGCHDLLTHDYGPGRIYASVHVEMDHRMDPLLCHETIDRIERESQQRHGVRLTIHYDPVLPDDPDTERLRKTVEQILKEKDERMAIHDFRAYVQDTTCELAFDVTLPHEIGSGRDALRRELAERLEQLDGKHYTLNITYDL